MHRNQRANIASETVDILRQHSYVNHHGVRIELSASIDACVAATRLVRPAEWDGTSRAASEHQQPKPAEIEVTGETTLAAIRRLASGRAGPVAALNFASAKNPGGGFLSGSQA